MEQFYTLRKAINMNHAFLRLIYIYYTVAVSTWSLSHSRPQLTAEDGNYINSSWKTVTAFQDPDSKLEWQVYSKSTEFTDRWGFSFVQIKHVISRTNNSGKDLWSLHAGHFLLLFKHRGVQSLRSWSCPVNICGSQLLCQHISYDVIDIHGYCHHWPRTEGV